MRQPAATRTLAKHWGGAVKDRRKKLGLGQQQLADLADVKQQTISKIESGLMIPHDRLKLVLANRLGIDPGVLFAWPDRTELTECVA